MLAKGTYSVNIIYLRDKEENPFPAKHLEEMLKSLPSNFIIESVEFVQEEELEPIVEEDL